MTRILYGEKTISSVNGAEEIRIFTLKRMNLDAYLIPLYQIINNLKWIKDLNIRPGTVKLLEENVGKKLSPGNDILDIIPKAQATKAKISN